MDDNGSCIISMYAHILNGIKYSLDKNTVEITYKDHNNRDTTQKGFTNLIDIDTHSTKWYHINLDLDFDAGTVKGTITDKESGDVEATINTTTETKNLSKFYAYNGYSAAPMSLDNVLIKGSGATDNLSLSSAVNIYNELDENNYQEYGIPT